jgi:hypothetical protein
MKLFRKSRAKKVEKTLQDNILVGPKVLEDIKRWETQKSDLIIRSSFNRELYYKLLSLKK